MSMFVPMFIRRVLIFSTVEGLLNHVRDTVPIFTVVMGRNQGKCLTVGRCTGTAECDDRDSLGTSPHASHQLIGHLDGMTKTSMVEPFGLNGRFDGGGGRDRPPSVDSADDKIEKAAVMVDPLSKLLLPGLRSELCNGSIGPIGSGQPIIVQHARLFERLVIVDEIIGAELLKNHIRLNGVDVLIQDEIFL